MCHVSPARRVWMTTSPDENRPYSTAYGFGITATESIASSGSVKCDEAEHRIGERARADLDAGLRRTSALDAEAAGNFDDAREQPQRAAEAVAARELLGLAAVDRSDDPIVSAADTIDAGAITSTVCVMVAIGRSNDRGVMASARHDHGGLQRREAVERHRQRVLAPPAAR